jgi:hypothetical protein
MAIDTSAAGVDPAALPHSSRRDSLRIVGFEPRHFPEAARLQTYEALYAALSARWADAGQLCHCVSVMTGNPKLEDSLIWSRFGLMSAVAVRDSLAALAVAPAVAPAAGADR